MPPIDWLHVAAVGLGAVATFFFQGKGTGSGSAAAPAAGLLDSLLKAFESRLAPTTVGPGGKTVANPLMTIRVVLVPESPAPPEVK